MRLGRSGELGIQWRSWHLEREREVEVEALVLSVDATDRSDLICMNWSEETQANTWAIYIHLEQLHDVHMKGTEVGGADT